MRIEQLKYLADIAKTGSLTSSAQRLFVSQQAISKSMQQLEKELGIEIFVRTNTGVTITPMGQNVVNFAKSVLAEEDKLSVALQKEMEASEESRTLNICSNSSVTNIVLPNIINDFGKSKQKINFRISMMESVSQITEKVQNGEFDLGLVTFNASELIKRFADYEDELHLDILVRDEMIAVMHKKFVKNTDGAIPQGPHLMTMYNIVPAYDSYYDVSRKYIVHSNDADFHRIMLEKNGAVVIMPALAQQYFFSSKQLVEVDASLDVPLLHAAIYRRDTDAQVQEVAAMIRRQMQLK